MPEKKKPPRWQKGHRQFEVVLPADKTLSGKEETVKLGFSWQVRATKPGSARNWTKWEMDSARDYLAHVANAVDRGEDFTSDHMMCLRSAVTHAVRAWCRTHLRGKGGNNDSYHRAFIEKGPEELRQLAAAFQVAMRKLGKHPTSINCAVAAAQTVVEAASHPPRNRRRFPADLRPNRPIRKPRVRPGSWIVTEGRYRPGQILEMMPDPPHTMKVSYGDEIDDDFRPHITYWQTVRKPKHVPSLKEHFTPGDWIRSRYSGYGKVLAVRNSRMDVDYSGRTETLGPNPGLSGIEKVSAPEPEYFLPASQRFSPGTWIDQAVFGKGVVLAIESNATLVVFFLDRIVRHIATSGDGPAIWKLEEKPMDLSSICRQRWVAWWRHYKGSYAIYGLSYGRSENWPCLCCGYPNLGSEPVFADDEKVCVICGWPEHGRYGDPFDQTQKKRGYRLWEAQQNYEKAGTMFRVGDRRCEPFEKMTALRNSLTELLERARASLCEWNDEDREAVEQVRQEILRGLRTDI